MKKRWIKIIETLMWLIIIIISVNLIILLSLIYSASKEDRKEEIKSEPGVSLYFKRPEVEDLGVGIKVIIGMRSNNNEIEKRLDIEKLEKLADGIISIIRYDQVEFESDCEEDDEEDEPDQFEMKVKVNLKQNRKQENLFYS